MHTFTFPTTLRSVALVAMVALGACSKKDDDTTPATTYATTWTADGKNYTATNNSGAVLNNTLAINAISAVSNSESYNINIAVPATTGTYAIGSTNTTISATYSTVSGNANTSYVAFSTFGSGTIVVTTLSSTEIIGTFFFTGTNTTTTGTTNKVISNGKFAIKR